jgi:hypothetical protein
LAFRILAAKERLNRQIDQDLRRDVGRFWHVANPERL